MCFVDQCFNASLKRKTLLYTVNNEPVLYLSSVFILTALNFVKAQCAGGFGVFQSEGLGKIVMQISWGVSQERW